MKVGSEAMRTKSQSLLVIGHVPHWIDDDGEAVAYEPYVRELRVWASLFGKVVVLSPKGEGARRFNLARYGCPNVEWVPINYTLSTESGSLLKRLRQIPWVAFWAARLMRTADIVHVRSPGHFGLVANVLVRLLRKPSITKWAGEFGAYEGERIISKVERILVGLASRRHPALIYGPSRRPDLISFLPALMSLRECEIAENLGRCREWKQPWRLLAVGRFVPEKGFGLCLHGLGLLRAKRPDLQWELAMVGDGPQEAELRRMAKEHGIEEFVRFTGAQPFERVQEHYGRSHIVIMPGTKEGWPKVIAEAWAHGAVPLAASGGLVPHLLGDDSSGALFEPSPEGLSGRLAVLLDDPDQLSVMAENGRAKGRELSLERFRDRLAEVIARYFTKPSCPDEVPRSGQNGRNEYASRR